MKLLLQADVSADGSHVGDEAMLEANVELLRRQVPGCEIVVAGGAGWDGAKLGVTAVPRLEFSPVDEEARDRMLDSISSGLQSDQPAVAAARSCDALIISGGGNLSRSWPHHIYERVAMARLAATGGARIIMLGQTLGPDFRKRERALVAELLGHSKWTGLRETYSYALALELGAERATLSYQLDDAAFLTPKRPLPEVLEKTLPGDGQPFIAVTVNPIGDASIHNPVIGRLASHLRTIAAATAARLVFVPHVAFDVAKETPSDAEFGEALGRAMFGNPPLHRVPVLPAAEALWLTQQASLVISTRYHPLVFGLVGGVPSVGIWQDEYTRRKIQGALIHAGRADDAMDLGEALVGGVVTKSLELWERRSALRQQLQDRVSVWRTEEEDRARKLGQHLQAG